MSARLLGPSALAGVLIGAVSVVGLGWLACCCCGPATMVGAFATVLLIGVLNRGIAIGQGVVSGLICGVTAAVIFSVGIRFHPKDEQFAQLLQAVEKGLEDQKAKAPSRELEEAIGAIQQYRRNKDGIFELRVLLGLAYSLFALVTAPIAGFLGALVFGRRPAPPPPLPMPPPPQQQGPES
jgi:hypothetical protein